MLNSTQSADTIISISIGGTAINGKDYQKLAKKVVVFAGNTSSVIDVVPIDDAKRERQETVKVTLLSRKNYKLGKAKKALVTITDND